MADEASSPDVIPYTPEEQRQFNQTGVVYSSASPPASESSSPDVIPYSADDIKGLMAANPYHPLSPEQARVLFDDDQSKSFATKAGELGSGFIQGAKGIGHTFAEAHREMKDLPFTAENGLRTGATLLEGAARGWKQDKGLAKAAFNYLTDTVGDTLTGADKETQFKHYYQQLLSKQRSARESRGLPEAQPENFDPAAPTNVLPESFLHGVKPLPATADAVSTLTSPVSLSTAGAGAALGAGVRTLAPVALRAGLELASKVPGGMAAAEGVSKALNAAVPAAEAINKVSSLPGKALSSIPGAVEKTASGVKSVAQLPGKVFDAAVDKIVPEIAQDKIHGIVSHATGVGALVGALGEAGTLGKAAAVVKGTQWAAEGVKQTAEFARRLTQAYGDSQVPRLLQLAKDAEAPGWLRGIGQTLHNIGAGKVAQLGADFAGSAAHGAAMGAALGELSGDSPEEVGQFAGAGVGLGVLGRAERKITGADAQARAIQGKLGDLQRFYEYLKSNGTPDETIQKISTDQALQVAALQAATARSVFGKNLDFAFLPAEQFNALAAQSGGQGTAAFHDAASKKIVVNTDATRSAFSHELGHAVLSATGADAEARLQIDSIFNQQDLLKLAGEYASKLVDSNLKEAGADKKTLSPEAYQKIVVDKLAQLQQQHGGDSWLYNEIYAESAYGGLLNRDIARDVLRPPLFKRLADGAREKYLSAMGLPTEKAPTEGTLFSDSRVYQSPELRKMVYDHLRQLDSANGKAPKVKETKEGTPQGTPVPKDLFGVHPSVPLEPNPSTGRLENDAAVKNPQTGEVTIRKPSEVRRIEKTRQAETLKSFASAPVLPKGDTNPAVAPRVNQEGQTEITGTKFSDQVNRMPQFGEGARRAVKMAEDMMGTGNVLDLWYQSVGRNTASWAGDVRKRLGNIAAAKVKLAPFEFRVSKEGNVLITGLSLTAAERKLAKWSADNKLELWNGDTAQFKADLLTYLKNHADNRPGSDSIGEKKRDALNAFVVGNNKLHSSKNPLRGHLRGEDKAGIIRSLRIDRMANPEVAPDQGWNAEYRQKVLNLSPDTQNDNSAPTSPQLTTSGHTDTNIDMHGFFSQAEKTINAKMPNKAPSASVKAILRNPQNGVKADEMKWTGLDDFLNENRTLTKAEVLKFLQENKVEIKEVMKGGAAGEDEVAAWWNDEGGANEETPFSDLSEQERQEAAARYQDEVGDYAEGSTKFSQYRLPGETSNYRELLFTLPNKPKAPLYTKVNLRVNVGESDVLDRGLFWVIDAPGQKFQILRSKYPNPANAIQYIIDQKQPTENPGAYKSSHWDEPNVLAHTRSNDRTDVHGKSVKFIEEIQSDWHQQGRKGGYKESKPPIAPADTSKWTVETTRSNDYTGQRDVVIRDENGETVSQRYGARGDDAQLLKEAAATRAQIDTKDRDTGKVPDAPFKNTWHELVLKRLLRKAAEEGKDKLAWTTGEQQAERYDLSKHIDGIGYSKRGSLFNVSVFDKNGGTVLHNDSADAQYIESHLGKEILEKMQADHGEKDPISGHTYLEGLDLKVGGEGMKGFYDKILVDFMNKYGKKWGARTSESWIRTDKDGIDPYVKQTTQGWTVFDTNHENIESFKTKPEAEAFLQSEKKGLTGGLTKVHSIDITPAMKKAVLSEGQPQYSPDVPKTVGVDGLPKETQGDIVDNLIDHIPFLQNVDHQDLRNNLFGLAQEPTVVRGTEDPKKLLAQFGKDRATSPAAVRKYRAMLRQGTSFDPVLVANGKFIDGGNRVKAYAEEGFKSIPVVDVSSLWNLNWEKWLSGSTEDQSYFPFEKLPGSEFSPDVQDEKKEAPVAFHSLQHGAPHIGWYVPQTPISAPDGGTYVPGGSHKISSGQLQNWGMKIPDAERAKFLAAGGAERKAFSPDDAQTEFPFNPDYTSIKSKATQARAKELWQREGIESPFFKKWFGKSQIVDHKGNPLRVFHGTDSEHSIFRDGVAFFAADKGIADQYRQRKIFENAGDIELPDDVGSVDELGLDGIQQLAKEEGIDLSAGQVFDAYLKADKVLDLTQDFQANFDPRTDWDDLHKLGLVEQKWKDKDPEARQEIVDEFGGKGMWLLLDSELHDAIQKKGYDAVKFKDVDMQAKPHETYAVFKPEQIKSASTNVGTFNAGSPDVHFSPDTPGFKAWFKDSKITEEDGTTPKVVYHGTRSNFTEFSKINGGNQWGDGYYFTTSPEEASNYAEGKNVTRVTVDIGKGSPVVMPVYLSVSNPFKMGPQVMTPRELRNISRAADPANPRELYSRFDSAFTPQAHTVWSQLVQDRRAEGATAILKKAGYDGITGGNYVVAFKPEQIKSALGNSGTFDKTNPDIRFSPDAHKRTQLTTTDPLRNMDGVKGVAEAGAVGKTLARAKKAWMEKGVESPFFKKWFGGSRIVGEDSKPLRVFHGSDRDFEAFSPGINYFTTSPGYASGIAQAQANARQFGTGARIYPAYLRIEKPFDISSRGESNLTVSDLKAAGLNIPPVVALGGKFKPSSPSGYPFWRWLKAYPDQIAQAVRDAGYDGMTFKETDYSKPGHGLSDVYVTLAPEQVKSASANKGTFDSGSVNIQHSPDTSRRSIQPAAPRPDPRVAARLRIQARQQPQNQNN